MTEENPVCPECKSTNHFKYGHSARGKQRYKCTNCGRSYILPEEHYVRPRSGYVCPRCGSLNVIWAGRTLLTKGRHKRRLKCKDCGRNFYQPEEENNG